MERSCALRSKESSQFKLVKRRTICHKVGRQLPRVVTSPFAVEIGAKLKNREQAMLLRYQARNKKRKKKKTTPCLTSFEA